LATMVCLFPKLFSRQIFKSFSSFGLTLPSIWGTLGPASQPAHPKSIPYSRGKNVEPAF
jgi:hypothetical protein